MSMIACKVEDGVVVNRAIYPDDAVLDTGWVANEVAQIGWLYDGRKFTQPVREDEVGVGVLGGVVITATQGKMQLLRMGLMTPAEAKANAIPTFITAIVDKMADAEGAELVLRWRESRQWHRDDPLFAGGLLDAAASALGLPATDATVDQFFTDAAAI